jgi:hypothetical protein
VWSPAYRVQLLPQSALSQVPRTGHRQSLPVPYFHFVFTLPAALGPLALQNPRVIYGLVLQATAETLLEVAAKPKHLGVEIGFLAVLHTRGRT